MRPPLSFVSATAFHPGRNRHPSLRKVAEQVSGRLELGAVIERACWNECPWSTFPFQKDRCSAVLAEPAMEWVPARPARFCVSAKHTIDAHSPARKDNGRQERRPCMTLEARAMADELSQGLGVRLVPHRATKTTTGKPHLPPPFQMHLTGSVPAHAPSKRQEANDTPYRLSYFPPPEPGAG